MQKEAAALIAGWCSQRGGATCDVLKETIRVWVSQPRAHSDPYSPSRLARDNVKACNQCARRADGLPRCESDAGRVEVRVADHQDRVAVSRSDDGRDEQLRRCFVACQRSRRCHESNLDAVGGVLHVRVATLLESQLIRNWKSVRCSAAK